MPVEDSPSGASPTRSTPAPTLSQPKPQPKIIRVLTVMAYMLSVSMAAILLSIYYIFVWNGGGGGSATQHQQQQPLAAPLISLKSDSDAVGGVTTSFDVVGGDMVGVADNTTVQALVSSEEEEEEAGTTGEAAAMQLTAERTTLAQENATRSEGIKVAQDSPFFEKLIQYSRLGY